MVSAIIIAKPALKVPIVAPVARPMSIYPSSLVIIATRIAKHVLEAATIVLAAMMPSLTCLIILVWPNVHVNFLTIFWNFQKLRIKPNF